MKSDMTSNEQQRRGAIKVNSAHKRILEAIDAAFDPRTCKRPTTGAMPTSGESMVWKLYCMERWEEERQLASIVHNLADKLSSGIKGQLKNEQPSKVAQRFIFAHWVLRLTSGIWATEQPVYPLFIASADSPLIDMCRYKTWPGSKAVLFDKILRGAALKSVEGKK